MALNIALVLEVSGTRIRIDQPHADAPFPWLTQTGTLLLAARAGHLEGIGAGETANMRVSIDNEGRQATNVLGYFLRCPAWLYDGDDLFFAGLAQSITFGRVLELAIED